MTRVRSSNPKARPVPARARAVAVGGVTQSRAEGHVHGVTPEQLTTWAESCLRINHLNTLVQREIASGSLQRAAELSERARRRAWELFNELLQQGATKPAGYTEPDSGGA